MNNSYYHNATKNVMYILTNNEINNKVYESYNDCLSLTEIAETLSFVTSKKITYKQLSMED